MLPCLIFEDEHLLVVNKPAGWNTHAPSPYAGEGLYDWLRHREPRWAKLAIIHRLDKETSGVLLFSKTSFASRSLTDQFTRRLVRKTYLLLTDRPVPPLPLAMRSCLVRSGERYVSRPVHAGGEVAETRFQPVRNSPVFSGIDGATPELPEPWRAENDLPAAGPRRQAGAGSLPRGLQWVIAEPLTGRTHQIRVHAAERGFPILGDRLYGGTPGPRLCLHAAELHLTHPVSAEPMTFRAPWPTVRSAAAAPFSLRVALIDPAETDAFRLLHGASDGWPGWQVDRLGNYLLSQSESALSEAQLEFLKELSREVEAAEARPKVEGQARASGVYHKTLLRQVRRSTPGGASPQLVLGTRAPDQFVVGENGLSFELSFQEGYSVGLFLDQRDNRRRLRTGHVAAEFSLPVPETAAMRPTLLNTFAYTCGFSVCAAKAGWHTMSLDLSKKYLAWGRRNFLLNQIDPAAHEFIFGDTFDWLRRLARKQRRFDLIVLDPPTFSQSKESGVFRVEKDYAKLVAAALPALCPGGVLLASTNAAHWPPEQFLATVEGAIGEAGRRLVQRHYAPQPPDFPVTRAEPAYLKTVWLRIQ